MLTKRCSLAGEPRGLFEVESGRCSSIPLAWTDLASPDAFVAISAGRSLFRVSDLLELTALLNDVERWRGIEGVQ